MEKKTYVVLIPFPLGGGHYAKKGAEIELLDVQAHQLETAQRIALVVDAPVPVATGKSKTSEKVAE